MKICNVSKNTIYIEDIDRHILYKDGESEEFSSDVLKKSKALRSIILSDMINILEFNEQDRMESSIVYIKSKNKSSCVKPESSKELKCNDQTEIINVRPGIDVKIHGNFYDAGGYAKVNRNLAMHLQMRGFNVQINPKRSINQLNANELSQFAHLERNRISKNHILIDSVIPSLGELSSGKYKILYTTVESYSVPNQLSDCCNEYDEVWTTSQWSADILRTVVKKPLYVVVPGVDVDLYTDNGPKFDLKPDIKDFVFISVFGWNYRKGWDVLLKAYFDEFSHSDNVSLLIVSRYQTGTSRFHKNKIKEDIDGIMKLFPGKNLPHVVRYNRVIPEKDMPKLYRSADAFVLPTRGESINLTGMEAAMCGLPVIMTNCSGQQEYLRKNNAFLLEPDTITELSYNLTKIHYWDGQKFPQLTSEKTHNDLRQLMRTAYQNRNLGKEKNLNMQKLLSQNYTWNHAANNAAKRLEKIYNQIKGV